MMILVTVLVAVSLTAYLGIAYLLYSKQDAIIFRGGTRPIYSATLPANAERLDVTAPDGTPLHGLLLPPETTSATPPALLIAYGGTGHDVGTFALFLRNVVFPQQNLTIAAFNYRGFRSQVMPASGGTPTQAHLYADALLEQHALIQQLQPRTVALLGYSLGSSVAAHVAAHGQPVAGLTLVSPFTSILALGQGRYPWLPIRLLLRSPFPTLNDIAHVTAPTTIIYGENDYLIPAAQPQALAEILKTNGHLQNITPVPGAGHVSVLYQPDFLTAVRRAILPQNFKIKRAA